jgi:glycosyltransferase involved in cell wall biosynthesis
MQVFDDAELIVCDNNSTDRTAQIARAAGAKVVFEAVNQIARARNSGAREARGDWLVFVDADSAPSRELFFEVKREIEGGTCLAGGSTISCGDVSGAAAIAIGVWNAMSRTMSWAAGAFIFVDAGAFRELGGFDEALFASEELELFRRLKRMARARGRRIAILHRHPLLTSDRKLRLYGWGEFFRFTAKTLLSRGRTLRRREDCVAWYDGRR